MTKDTAISLRVPLHWMQDGAHLLMAAGPRTENQDAAWEMVLEQQLYLVDVTSGERKPVGSPLKGDDRIHHVSVHPNGTTLAFSRGEEITETWAIENLVFDQ